MHRLAHTLPARLAALLLALTFSGVAQALPPDPRRPHRCECRAHGERHVCACPICNAAARKARAAHARGDAAAVPPCHRAAAARAEADERTALEHRRERPCVLPSCGTSRGPEAAPRIADPFPLPTPARLARVEWALPVAARPAHVPVAAHAPELPPPRRA